MLVLKVAAEDFRHIKEPADCTEIQGDERKHAPERPADIEIVKTEKAKAQADEERGPFAFVA